jgi:zinc protease
MRCASLGGSRLENGLNRGATELLSRIWTSGAGALSEFEMNVRIDEMASSLSAFAGRNSQGLSMSCLRPFEKDMLDLFFTTLIQPSFEAEAVAREKKSMIEHVKLRQDNPAQTCRVVCAAISPRACPPMPSASSSSKDSRVKQ